MDNYDKRKHKRFSLGDLVLSVRRIEESIRFVVLEHDVKDIGFGGICFITKKLLALGDKVSIHAKGKKRGYKFGAHAEVRWISKPNMFGKNYVGARFVKLSPESKQTLAKVTNVFQRNLPMPVKSLMWRVYNITDFQRWAAIVVTGLMIVFTVASTTHLLVTRKSAEKIAKVKMEFFKIEIVCPGCNETFVLKKATIIFGVEDHCICPKCGAPIKYMNHCKP